MTEDNGMTAEFPVSVMYDAHIAASRYHDFCAGHRVYGHENKCAHLHGHNYRVHFHCRAAKLDSIGRVLDFSIIKVRLCMWVEKFWDHRFLMFCDDPLLGPMRTLDQTVVSVPFNPTAENMAHYLLQEIGPRQLSGTSVELFRVVIEETRKCSAEASL